MSYNQLYLEIFIILHNKYGLLKKIHIRFQKLFPYYGIMVLLLSFNELLEKLLFSQGVCVEYYVSSIYVLLLDYFSVINIYFI